MSAPFPLFQTALKETALRARLAKTALETGKNRPLRRKPAPEFFEKEKRKASEPELAGQPGKPSQPGQPIQQQGAFELKGAARPALLKKDNFQPGQGTNKALELESAFGQKRAVKKGLRGKNKNSGSRARKKRRFSAGIQGKARFGSESI